MKLENTRWTLSTLLPLLAGCATEPVADETLGTQTRALAKQNSPQVESTASPHTASQATASQVIPSQVTAPEMTLKFNDDLSAFTRILVPALGRSYGLNGMSLPALPLVTDTSK